MVTGISVKSCVVQMVTWISVKSCVVQMVTGISVKCCVVQMVTGNLLVTGISVVLSKWSQGFKSCVVNKWSQGYLLSALVSLVPGISVAV